MAEQIFIIEDGTLTKFECDDYVQEVYIPNCVKRIGCRASFEAVVGKVVIPNSVTTIEADAFLDCTLEEIEERGRFENVAEECLRHQKDPNQ